jgi:cyclic pyranopterin phosphate synthase
VKARRAQAGLTHFDAAGKARMVEVGDKAETARTAVASGVIVMAPATARAIAAGKIGKGDELGLARVAGIPAVKRTAELIPLCHPLRITGVRVDFACPPPPPGAADGPRALEITVEVRAFDRTGVEMEALTAVAVAALTVYDMCKAIDRGMRIEAIGLDEKRGGKSGTWRRARARSATRRT